MICLLTASGNAAGGLDNLESTAGDWDESSQVFVAQET